MEENIKLIENLFKVLHSNIINLDGSVIDNEVSMFADEYDIAVSLEKSKNGILINWKNNKDGITSTSSLMDYPELIPDIMVSIMAQLV